MAKIPFIKPPTQLILTDTPLTKTIITKDKKYKLNTVKTSFLFFLNINVFNLIFLQYNYKSYRIAKLLKEYTNNEANIREQFKTLLHNPKLIQDVNITNCIIEAIYLLHEILNLDLTEYINTVNLITLQEYYFNNIKRFLLY